MELFLFVSNKPSQRLVKSIHEKNETIITTTIMILFLLNESQYLPAQTLDRNANPRIARSFIM